MSSHSLPRYPLALLTAALLAPLAVPRPPVPAPKGYDLRGPALEKGLKLTLKRSSTMKDGDLEMDAGGAKRAFKVTSVETTEKEVELLAVEGRQPTRLSTRVVKGENKLTYTGPGAPPEVKNANPLAGLTVRSDLEKDAKGKRAWKHALDKGEVTDEQRPFFDRLGAWSPEDGFFPARKVRAGESWDVGTKDLTTFAGGGPKMKGFSAKGRGKLRGVERYDGETCAVVEITLTLKGTEETGGLSLAFESTAKVTVYRSLRRGINLKTTTESTTKATSDKVKIRLSGKEQTVTTATVKGG
jgi:hypothetical protein